ncbi:predicted protein [Chaetoceros tenuissimus]|uniref:Uncharacterized protein n=1 Tax=Chaetoceros tenuissimus TaxID=426638 RepID=A0AAD3CX13_9STRA|nr:predicted protein [Chaetoceros tenuissimus]
MFISSNQFHNPPATYKEVAYSCLAIFKSEWKILFGLSASAFVSATVTCILLGLVLFFLFREQIEYLLGSEMSGGNRYLAEGIDIISSFLKRKNQEVDNPSAFSIAALFVVAALFLLSILLTGSTYNAAATHAVAVTYTGHSPCMKSSVQYGMKKAWSVLAYQTLLSLGGFALLSITLILPAEIGIKTHNSTFLIIGSFLSIFVFWFLQSLLAVSIPVIVIENKTALEGLKRSYEMCKNSKWFTFNAIFMYNFLLGLITQLLVILMCLLPQAILSLGLIVVNMVLLSLFPIVFVVIYISLSVRNEGLTLRSFSVLMGRSYLGDEVLDLNKIETQMTNMNIKKDPNPQQIV